MLESYYAESLYKEDYNFRLENISGVSHYLCDRKPFVSDRLKTILEERYNVYRAYYIVCVDFSNNSKDLIANYNSNYKNSFILSNPHYQKAVIKKGYCNKETLTTREVDCLILFSQGQRLDNFKVISNIYAARREIAQTNLMLLNSI